MIQFPIIKIDEKNNKRRKGLIAWISIGSSVGVIASFNHSVLIMVVLSIILLYGISSIVYGLFFIHPYVTIGSIEFKPGKVVITEYEKTTDFEIDKMDDIKINYAKTWSGTSMPIFSQAGITWLHFNSQGQQYSIQFLIKPEFMFRDFEYYCEMLKEKRNAIVLRNGINMNKTKLA